MTLSIFNLPDRQKRLERLIRRVSHLRNGSFPLPFIGRRPSVAELGAAAEDLAYVSAENARLRRQLGDARAGLAAILETLRESTKR